MRLYVDNSWITEELDDLSYLHLFDHRKFDFVNDINNANVLLQTDFNYIRNFNGKKVLICMEPRIPRDYEKYDLVISTHKNYPNMSNILYIPFMFFYLYTHKYTDYILNRRIYFNPENKKKFCIFINSNNNAWQRIDFCSKLMSYKKVDCYAGVLKNCEGFTPRYWTHEFLNLVRQYKFMICFENSDVDGYITEKPANAYLGDTVPIYWGNRNSNKILNVNSLVYLEEYNESCIIKALQEIVYLDNNDEAYKNKIAEPLFLNNQIPEEFELKVLKNIVCEKLSI